MNCKNCGKEVPLRGTPTPDRPFGTGYFDYCSSFCYAVYNKKFSSYIYQKGRKNEA